ncbi:unnamed protein product [Ectocarpus sp. 8 AP-2014]
MRALSFRSLLRRIFSRTLTALHFAGTRRLGKSNIRVSLEVRGFPHVSHAAFSRLQPRLSQPISGNRTSPDSGRMSSSNSAVFEISRFSLAWVALRTCTSVSCGQFLPDIV